MLYVENITKNVLNHKQTKNGENKRFSQKACLNGHACLKTGVFSTLALFSAVQKSLYHGLAICTEVTFVNVTLVEEGPSGGGLALI